MKIKMKIKIIPMILTGFMFFATGCIGPGLGAWYYDLPNNYKIEHVESYPITFLSNDKKYIKRKVEDSVIKSHIIIENYITEFCYNNRWIAVKRVDIPEQVIQSRNLKNVNLDDVEYYLLDTYNNKLKSHMNEEEFKNYIKDKEIKDLCEWIPTFPANPIGSRGID